MVKNLVKELFFMSPSITSDRFWKLIDKEFMTKLQVLELLESILDNYLQIKDKECKWIIEQSIGMAIFYTYDQNSALNNLPFELARKDIKNGFNEVGLLIYQCDFGGEDLNQELVSEIIN